MPPVAAVDEAVALPDHTLLYQVATYLRPPYFLRYDEHSRATAATKLVQTSPIHFEDAVVTRTFAASRDGTQVPVNIIAPKGMVRNGVNPTLLYGYGGYNISEEPHFLGAPGRIWLDGHGVYAIANIRGGGEYGADWHAQGRVDAQAETCSTISPRPQTP